MQHVYVDSITDIDTGVIAHQVNCQGITEGDVFGAILDKYPGVKNGYEKWIKGLGSPENVFGTVQMILVSESKNLSIANIFSQKNCGYTDEKLLVEKITEICREYPYRQVYIPERIGCGYGGGDWDFVLQGLEKECLDNLCVAHQRKKT